MTMKAFDTKEDQEERAIKSFEKGECPKCGSDNVEMYADYRATNVFIWDSVRKEYTFVKTSEGDDGDIYGYNCNDCDYMIQF